MNNNILGIDGHVASLATGKFSVDSSDEESELSSGRQSEIRLAVQFAVSLDEFATFGLIEGVDDFFAVDGFFTSVFGAATGTAFAVTDGFFAIFFSFFALTDDFFAIAGGLFAAVDGNFALDPFTMVSFDVFLLALFVTATDSWRSSWLCKMCC